MHILLVEDTPAIWKSITEYLSLSWFEVHWYETIASAHLFLANHHIDCAVLDRMLPDGDGSELCKEIKSSKDIPVIMMTAKNQIEDKTQAYGNWADDYITKPFDLKELELRINAVMRRSAENESEDALIRIHNLVIDVDQHTVYADTEKVPLSHTEFLIVKCLAENKWRVISRTDLLEEIRWEESMRWGDNKLDVYIYALRKKLGKDVIRTVKGVGYQINS